MEQAKLQGILREETGKSAVRKLRAAGLIPGVAYGLGLPPVTISLPEELFRSLLRSHEGGNVLIDLAIEGVKTNKDTAAIVKEIQRHPLSRKLLSVDLQWVSLKELIHVVVPIVPEGVAPGVTHGGSLDLLIHELTVSCLPTQIPQHIAVDISALEIGDTLHVFDLVIPEGVEVLGHTEEPVVTVLAPFSAEQMEARLGTGELEGVELAEEGAEAAPAEAAEE